MSLIDRRWLFLEIVSVQISDSLFIRSIIVEHHKKEEPKPECFEWNKKDIYFCQFNDVFTYINIPGIKNNWGKSIVQMICKEKKYKYPLLKWIIFNRISTNTRGKDDIRFVCIHRDV